MALLSFFGSAQAILKILQCKTFSITTAEMSRLTTTGITRSAFVTNRYGGFPITDHANRCAESPEVSYSIPDAK
jgi:hypothetical protein